MKNMKQLLSRHLSIATADFWGYKARQLFRNLLLVSVLLSLNTFSSFAQFTAADWYNLGSSNVEKELDCSPILKFTLTATNDGDIQFQILNGEIGYTSGVDMVDNGVGLTPKAGDDGKVLAWQTPSVKAGEEFVFYLDPSTYPLELLPSMPTGTQVYMNLTSGKTAINYNDTVKLEAMPCPDDYTGDFVWQTSTDGSTWKSSSSSTENLTYIQNTDSTYYRVGIKNNGTDIFSAPLLIYFKPLQLSLNANGAALTNRVYNDDTYSSAVEFEVPRWSTIKFSPNWLGKAKENITLNKIYKKKLSESSWSETTLEGEDFGWEILADDNIEFKILANIEKEDGNIEYTMHVIVRATLECDETTIPDTLWFDDFGRFEDESTYVFERYDPVSKTKTEETASVNLTDNEGTEYDIKNFWATDPNNSVREHNFALKDDLSGPFNPADCDSDDYAHYACWEGCNGYRIEDGFFAICPDPDISNCGMTERDYWKGGDHTGNANGGMLFVNCADVVDKVIYEKEISLDKACNNAMLLFDAYVNNATRKQSNAPVNVRLDVFDSNGTLVHSVSSGDIYPRSDEKHNWAKLSFLFPASGMQYKIQIVNNMPGGSVNAGNDILLDDICISICYPSIDLLAESLAGKPLNSVETCELDDAIKLYAFNKNGIENYISKPLYLFQYNKSEVGGEWITIPNDTSSSRLEITPRNPETGIVDERFVGMTRIRAIVASRSEIIDDICAGNPPVVDCDNVYAIDSSFVLNVNYSGPMGLQLDTAGCVNEVMKLNGEPNGRVKFAWVKIGEGASADTISREISYNFTIPANNSEGKVDSFMFYAFEKLGCVDSQLITVRTKEFVKFTVPGTDFVVCEDESKVTLTGLYPAKLDNIAFRWRVTGAGNDTIYKETVKGVADYTIPFETNSVDSLNGKVFVEMYSTDSSYCAVDKSFKYDIHKKYSFDLELSDNIINNTLCVSSESGVEISLTANATPKSTARPKTFYWYRQELKEDGSKDTTLVLTTNSNTFKETITGNHTYVYFVSASDGVCYKDQDEANANVESSNDTVEARLPLDLSLRIGNAKSDSICDGSEIELKAIVDNSLTSKTDIVWTYTGITNGLENETISSGDTTIKRTPVSSSDFMESGVVTITATDKVCTDNSPKSEVTYKMFKNIKLALEYDRNDSLFCLEEGKENKICLTANVSSGNPSNYYWYKNGEFIGSTKENKNCIAISDGKNDFSIKVTDDVCILDTANAASAKDSLPIEARLPIKLAITPAKDSVCFGESLNYSVVVTNPLNDNTVISWAVEDANIEKASTTGNKVSNVVTPTIEHSRTSDGSVTVTTTDEVCTTNKPAATADYKVFRKIGLKFDVSLTDDRYFCLSTTEANNTMTVTAKDTTGEPALYIWYMDGKEEARTKDNKYTYMVTDGEHNFSVVVLDNVCHKEGGEPYKIDYDFEARYPIELTLASDKSVICEGDEIEFSLTAKNLKKGDTKVGWTFDKNSVNVSEQTAETTIKNGESSTSKTFSPVSMPDNFDGSRRAETRDVIVSVKDEVCNKNATKTLTYSLRKKFELSLVAPDVVDGKVCAKTDNLKSVTVNAVVSRGEPKKFIWSDGKESAALVNTNTFALSVGENNIGVKVSDGVCPDLSTSAGDSLSILIREPISVDVTSSIPSPMCINKTVVFTANVYNSDPSSKTSIWWDNAELGAAETINNGKYVSKSYKFPIGDVYENIVVNFKEADGKEVCPQSSALYTMKVQDTVDFVIDASSYGVCQDTTSEDSLRKIELSLKVIKGNPQSVVWFNGEEHLANYKDSILIVPMENFLYWAYVKDDVCFDSEKKYVSDTVIVAHKMDLGLKAEDISVQMGDDAILTAIPSNPLYSGEYEWYLNDSTSTPIGTTEDANFSHQLDLQGDYVIYAKTVNSVCGDVFSKIEIEVADYTNIPNAFTPDNGNAKNDVFMKGYMVQIFNRYQQVVYEGKDGWDGTYRGQLAEPGTYFYRLIKKDGRVLKGTIELTKF